MVEGGLSGMGEGDMVEGGLSGMGEDIFEGGCSSTSIIFICRFTENSMKK